jgi:hypothetical protein
MPDSHQKRKKLQNLDNINTTCSKNLSSYKTVNLQFNQYSNTLCKFRLSSTSSTSKPKLHPTSETEHIKYFA